MLFPQCEQAKLEQVMMTHCLCHPFQIYSLRPQDVPEIARRERGPILSIYAEYYKAVLQGQFCNFRLHVSWSPVLLDHISEFGNCIFKEGNLI